MKKLSKMWKRKWKIAIVTALIWFSFHNTLPMLAIANNEVMVAETGQQQESVEKLVEEVDVLEGDEDISIEEYAPVEEKDIPAVEGEEYAPVNEKNTLVQEYAPVNEIDTPIEEVTTEEIPTIENDEQAVEDELENINTHQLFTEKEQENPNIWWDIPDYVVTMPETGNPHAWLQEEIQRERPSGSVVHIVLTSHIHTGQFSSTRSNVIPPENVTVVLIGYHSNESMSVLEPNDRRVVINDSSHRTSPHSVRVFSILGNSNYPGVVVFRNVVIQNGFPAPYGRPDYIPLPRPIDQQRVPENMGGGVSLSNGGRAILDSGSVIRNSSSWNSSGGGISIASQSSLTMLPQSKIFNNWSSNSSGGGVSVAASTFHMYGGEIFSNTSTINNPSVMSPQGGGGINIINSTFNWRGGVIRNNHAGTNGGGIRIAGVSAVVTMYDGVELKDNSATNDILEPFGTGGGIYLQSGTLNMQGGSIYNNTARQGAGICVPTASHITTLNITGGEIHNNQASERGGGISYISTIQVPRPNSRILQNVRIYENTADVYGGGIYLNAPSHVTTPFIIEPSTIISANQANYGGGIYVHNTHVEVQRGEISENVAHRSGGGAYVTGTAIKNLSNTRIYNNNAQSGGGIHLAENANITVSHSVFEENRATYGGGINLSSGSARFTINSGNIDNNTATQDGGGVWVAIRSTNNTQEMFVANGGYIQNNVATEGDGGGIFADHTDLSAVYRRILPEGAYNNVTIREGVRFTGNRAYHRPIAPPHNSLPNIVHTAGYVSLFARHRNESLLNNYDINFSREDFFSLLSVPSFHFGEIKVSQTGRLHAGTGCGIDPCFVEIVDEREENADWTLTVRQEGKFTNEHNITADLRIILSKIHNVSNGDDYAIVADKVEILPNIDTPVMWSSEEGSSSFQSAQFGEFVDNRSTGVHLYIPRGESLMAGRYETSLTWTLSDVLGNN